MAKVRARAETGTLYLDFFYRGVRCREQTTLPDTAENRSRVQALMSRISKEIKQGLFDYAATFPNSPKAARFSAHVAGEVLAAIMPPTPKQALPETPTFAEFSVTWRAEMAPQWRRLHSSSVDATFEAHLLPEFGKKRLSDITKADVLAFRAKLPLLPGRADKTLSASTINKVIGILRQMLTESSDRYGLPDAFKGVRRLRARRPDVQPFSLVEVEKIRSTIRVDFRNYVTVRFFTGMRTGEINGLKWKYVDMERGLILVRETYSAGESEEATKTQQSARDIPMLPEVRRAMEDQFAQRDLGNPYVFTSRGGFPLDAHNFANRIWYPLLRYLEIEKRRPYQTRHTAATLMLAAGESPEWIARVMGHANTQMLFTVYSRYVPNLTRQDGLAFSGLINTGSGADTTAVLSPDQLASMDVDELRRALADLVAR
ncbi:Arm DNA-binding domain-containing protein [Lysobacter sp. A286]